MSDALSLLETISLLTPCEVPSARKVRIGHPYADGGYVMVERFRPGQKVYSYGISTDVSFDHDLAQRGLHVFMYDHTIADLPSSHPNFHFVKEGIASTNQPTACLFQLAHHVGSNNHTDIDMILKIDVEGAEWSVLCDIDSRLLSRFEQIVIELHDLDRLTEEKFRQKFVCGISRLRAIFNIIHVHANNNLPVTTVMDLQIPPVIEISLLRKDLGRAVPWQTFIPTELDCANCSKPDYVLTFFPFLPTSLPADDFELGLVEARRLASRPLRDRVPLISTCGTNIAIFGRCSQSSTSPWSAGPNEAMRALRTDRDGSFAFHTNFESGPWWQIDFGIVREFDEIICFNRLDACRERAQDMIVETSGDGSSWNILHANDDPFGGIDGSPLRITCQRAAARYVRLRLLGNTALHLDGVEIYDWHSP